MHGWCPVWLLSNAYTQSKPALHTSQIYKHSSTTLWWNPATEWNTYARQKKTSTTMPFITFFPIWIFFRLYIPFCWLPSPLVSRKIQWLTCASFLPKQLWLASVVTATGQFNLLRHVRRETLTDGNWWQLGMWTMCRLHKDPSHPLMWPTLSSICPPDKRQTRLQWWGNIWKHHVLRSRSQQLTSSYVKIPQQQTRQRYKMSWLGSRY